MSTAVIDASVVLRWAFEDEEDRAGAERVAAAIASGDLDVEGPPNFLLEICAALAIGIRGGRIDRTTADDVLAGLAKVAIPEGDPHGFAVAAFELALDHGIRVPDAASIETARQARATLVSADQAQLQAAANLGIPVVRIADVGSGIPDSP
ncbi:MAG TPA: type II toxin-antitoxin system VapC family toxin [Candidatus Limnocylindrales bacterium]|nr:type II toxin-antitoxin system VapC family toxin [Candidatus Limnocylindrales bacterium]